MEDGPRPLESLGVTPELPPDLSLVIPLYNEAENLPVLAAEMFSGMTLGHGHLRVILGVPQPPITDVRARAQEVARRFVRAFAAV